MSDAPSPAIWLISGVPGAGKSTVAGLLARRFERGVHVEGDLLQRMIVAGGVWPEGAVPSPEAERQMTLRARNACLLAGAFYDAGFSVALDDVLIPWRLDEYLKALAGRTALYVLLLPSTESVRDRNRGRPDRDVFATWGFLDEEVRRTTRRGLWLDSSGQSTEETVEEVLRRWPEALLS